MTLPPLREAAKHSIGMDGHSESRREHREKFSKAVKAHVRLGARKEIWVDADDGEGATGLLDVEEVPFARMDSRVGMGFRPLEQRLYVSDGWFGGASEGGNARRRVDVACNERGKKFKLRSLYNSDAAMNTIEISERHRRVFSRFHLHWHLQTTHPTRITSALMDGNPPPPPLVKLVRAYTRLPKLTIPTLESIRAKGTSSTSNSPVAPSPSSASTQISLRAPKRTCWQKVDHVLTTYGFDSLGEFLSVLFHPRKRGEKDRQTKSHWQTVAAFLKGQSKITMAHIIPLIYNHHRSRPKRDTNQHSAAFSSSIPLSEIRYARPCLSAWATRLVGDQIYYGVGKLARHNRTDARNHRHLRATTNKRVNNTDAIEWEDVAFSVEELAALYEKEDKFLWYLTECFAASRKGGKVIVKKIRPHPIIQVGAIRILKQALERMV
ncbi:hypothetical protein DFH09DRAFT_1495516 [Mycena vulgaris]|nr:hypothetical protein DFH09DRAFT_1495516 [Mycena vulgaris]